MNMREIERPQWRSSVVVKAARLNNEEALVEWRRLYKFALGHFMAGKQQGWLYSTLDVAEITVASALISVGLKHRQALRRAHEERGKLRSLLFSRLVEGYMPLGIIRFEAAGPIPGLLAFEAHQFVARVIYSLQLPLPIVSERPPTAKLEADISQTVAIWVQSDEFKRHVDLYRQLVTARGTPANWEEASQALSVPLWIIRSGEKEEREAAERGAEVPKSIKRVLAERLQLEMAA